MQDSTIAIEENPGVYPDEPDGLFGICHAVGEHLGFNPFYLRLALLGLLFFSATAAVAAYVALGIAVAVSSWLFPAPKTASAPLETPVERPVPAAEQVDERELVAA